MPRYIDADLLKLQIERGAEMTERGIRLLDLSQQPTADVAPVVHAHWTNKKEKWHDGETYCSACGAEAGAEYGRYTYLETEYCPNCGARMDEREET